MEFENGDVVVAVGLPGNWKVKDKVPALAGYFNYRIENVKTGDLKRIGGAMLKSLEEHELMLYNEKVEKMIKERVTKTEIMFDEDVETGKLVAAMRGHLARNGRIDTNIPPKAMKWFEERHFTITGTYPDPKFYKSNNNDDQRAEQLKVVYKCDKSTAEQMLIPGMVLTKTDGGTMDSLNEGSMRGYEGYFRKGYFTVSKNELVYQLLHEGFVLGNKQDYVLIKSRIKPEYHEAFDEGFSTPAFTEFFTDVF